MSGHDREYRVDGLIQELGLIHVADAFVGDEENRGISGGERKRVSIGVDVIHDPPIRLLDEPTSGLDSSSALHVVELLSSMARPKQRTIVLSIHQPSYRILQCIPNFLILSHGSVVHHGSLESLELAITRQGFRIPPQINPLEFSMEIISTLEESYSKNNHSLKESKQVYPPSYSRNLQIKETSADPFVSRMFDNGAVCEAVEDHIQNQATAAGSNNAGSCWRLRFRECLC